MKDMTQGSIAAHLAHMSLFIGTSMLIQTLYYLVDLYFVAGLGEQALAGVSAAGNVMAENPTDIGDFRAVRKELEDLERDLSAARRVAVAARDARKVSQKDAAKGWS